MEHKPTYRYTMTRRKGDVWKLYSKDQVVRGADKTAKVQCLGCMEYICAVSTSLKNHTKA